MRYTVILLQYPNVPSKKQIKIVFILIQAYLWNHAHQWLETNLTLIDFGCQWGNHSMRLQPPWARYLKAPTYVFARLRVEILPQAKEPEAGMMSFWGLCSAWSVPLWLQSDSLLEEFNLHHTPHRSSLPFYQSIFRGITPTDLSQPGRKCTSAFKL